MNFGRLAWTSTWWMSAGTAQPSIAAFLVRFFKSRRVDILHTHRYKDTVLATIAAKLAGVPRVVRTVHGLAEPMTGWDKLKFRVYGVLDTTALRYFGDRIIAVSHEMANTLQTVGYRRSRIVPIHNGIDVGKARVRRDPRLLRRELGVDDDALLIGTIGRLAPVKAHNDLLLAAQRILRRRPEARFLFVGDGPLRNELLTSAVQLGIDRACLFTGSRQDTFDLLAAMDVFVLPSLHEGVPMALLEAMILGKAVVATAVGGVPEVVQNRMTGILVPRHDDRALADACLELAADERLARSLGLAARRAVADRFSHDVSGGALMNVYRSLGDTCPTTDSRSGADLSTRRVGVGTDPRIVPHRPAPNRRRDCRPDCPLRHEESSAQPGPFTNGAPFRENDLGRLSRQHHQERVRG